MSSLVYFVIACVILSYAGCDDPMNLNGTLMETAKDFLEDAGGVIGNGSRVVLTGLKNVGEDLQKVFDDVFDEIMEGEPKENGTTESLGIDAAGCDRDLRQKMEERCDIQYDKVNEEAQLIEDNAKKTEALCCALEDFEKCSLRAYDKANCLKDKAAIRESLKAAHLFLSVIANVTCTKFRGQCAYYSSAIAGQVVCYTALIASALFSIKLALM